ncbi:hypothetical protein LCGC14_0288850 [marine sediment metagenome]|uniref:RecF/RecN/SMC N-terminal domain-containing protein n=1 Tax=marine sediment metagenome TaxID=412755 RepID=A0A0F9WZC7_9ZZZZ
MSEVAELRTELDFFQRQCAGWRGQGELLEGQKAKLDNQKAAALEQEDVQAKALIVLQSLEKTWRGHYEKALAALGGQGINAVFTDAEYEVLLESTIKRGVASLDIILVKDGKRVRLKGGTGGSVVQVLAYLLRHFMTTSQHPEWRRLEALDEPFSMVATEQRPALCQLVKEITERLGFQLIFSSHEDEVLDAADVAYLVNPGGTLTPLKSGTEDRS